MKNEKRNQIELSIIIPVYNTEKYIRKCLDSIFEQNVSHKLFEVIVVNDGTKDKSLDIIYEFTNLYDNIILINQENQGLSQARNNGLKIAKGKFVWFVDSDDWIRSNSIKTILEVAKDDVDIISSLLNRVDERTMVEKVDIRNQFIRTKSKMTGKDYLFDEGIYAPVQQFVYRRGFLKNNELYFYPGILHEDGQFNMRALYLCNNLFLLNTSLYNYLLRSSGSIMRSKSIKNARDLLTIHKTLVEFGNSFVKKEDICQWFACISSFISVIFYWLSFLYEDDDFRKFIKDNKKYINKYIWDKLHLRHFHLYNLRIVLLIYFAPFFYMKSLNKK